MRRYTVTCAICGNTVNVPTDKARSRHEEVSQYGMQAVLERYHRTRHVLQHIADGSTATACNGPIITPDGETVTQY